MYLFKRKQLYYLAYLDENENREKRISTKCKTKKDALQFLSEFKEKRRKKPIARHRTILEFEQEYLEYVKKNFSKTYCVTVGVSFRLLRKSTGNVQLQKVTVYQLEKFFTETFSRTKEGARTYLIALKSAYNKAIKWGYIHENPFTEIKLPRIPKNNPIFINEDELKLILDQVSNKTLRDLYLFAFHTGMRLGEITNLQWEQVHLNERIIQVNNSKEFTPKGKRERVVPVNDTLFFMLQNRLPKVLDMKKKNYVFHKYGFKFNGDYVSKRFKDSVIEAAKGHPINERIHFHSLRHSFASNLAKSGVSLFVIKDLLGHRDITTTQIYSHLTIDALREAVKVLG